MRLFGWNRRNVVSLHDRDHLDVRAFLAEHGIEADRSCSDEPARARLRVQPGQLLLLLPGRRARLHRRRGQQHLRRAASLPPLAENQDTGERRLSYRHDKKLHVSPFFGLDQSYQWWFSEPGEQLDVRIDIGEGGSRPFFATLTGTRRPLTSGTLARALIRYPLMPLQVTVLIHFQAARLWLKRVPFFHKPPFVPGKGSVKR